MDETSGTTPVAPEPAEMPAAPAPPAPPAAPAPYAAPAPAAADMMGRPAPVNDTSKLLAALGYLIWPVALVAILMDPYKNEKFVKFHAVQALGLNVAGWIIAMIPYVQILGIVVFVFMIIALIKAFQAQYYEVPLVYGLVKGYIGGEE